MENDFSFAASKKVESFKVGMTKYQMSEDDTDQRDDELKNQKELAEIQQLIEKQADENMLDFSEPNNALIKLYINQLQNEYDVSRVKQDTDCAVSLLYIAYNATPQIVGSVRVSIDRIMADLIREQKESVNIMGKVGFACNRIKNDLELNAKIRNKLNLNDPVVVKDFLNSQFIRMVKKIKDDSNDIAKQLRTLSGSYNKIISDSNAASYKNQLELAKETKERQRLLDQIAEMKSDSEKMEGFVSDLSEQIRKYDNLAAEYKQKAETAEERSFIMSIISVCAEMVAATAPAITAALTGAATGGASIMSSHSSAAMRKMMAPSPNEGGADDSAQLVKLNKEFAIKTADKKLAEKELSELEAKKDELEEKKKEIESNTDLSEEKRTVEQENIDKEIVENGKSRGKTSDKIKATEVALEGIQAALNALSKGMEKISEKQEQQGASLREMQLKMLNTVQKFEEEKRKQNAELIKVRAMIKSKETNKSEIELSIRSLGISTDAIKAMVSIINELAYFFESFAIFMGEISKDASGMADSISEFNDGSKSLASLLEINLKTSYFFVAQHAEWMAISMVASIFKNAFNTGWSKLNKLNGKYLTGDALITYLDGAADQLDEIAFKRASQIDSTIFQLDQYR
ncbi:hypothetical protein HZU75_06420 [Chitinibacter fontanus]|uniref:Uncharacterized protein n=1 Tax=Chitinibacter fontanus TaxID=1737446 RepID=A0A7D5V9C0_9NEIS|nr:hypothetical protein [Chitinibacter fontanus]QLI81194.1 hypothetical protein HZU75_06420 [Chitinibacter fontanus]